MVAVKDRLNALKNPYAHLQLPDITIEKVKESPMLWDPLHFLESCPSSDGACAVVLDERGRRPPRLRRPPAWVVAHAVRSEPATFPGRDPVSPQAGVDCAHDVYRRPGITNPRRADRLRRALRAVQLVRADVARGPRIIAGPGEGWKMTERGETEIDGHFPVNPSGGVLSSNPIGASGMLRFAEARQPGARARPASTRSTGPGSPSATPTAARAQYFSMWVVSSEVHPAF